MLPAIMKAFTYSRGIPVSFACLMTVTAYAQAEPGKPLVWATIPGKPRAGGKVKTPIF